MKSAIVAALGLVFSTFATGAFAADPIVIKFSHVVSAKTPKGKAADFFAKKAAELTKGQVIVEVYPNSVLYKDKDEVEALQLNMVQMLAPSTAKFSPFGFKEFEAFDLPYMFDGYDDLVKVTEGPAGKQLLSKLESKGISGLAYWNNGFKSFSANTPLKTPADFKGKRMRIQPSKVLEAQMSAIGAQAIVLPFSEVFKAMESQQIDGAENPPSNIFSQKMHTVQKHITMTNHGYLAYALIVNKKFWNGLPPEIRKQLDDAAAQTTVYANQIAKEENDNAIDAIKKAGKTTVYYPTDAERLALKKAMIPVHAQMADRIGKETIDAFYKATGFEQKLR